MPTPADPTIPADDTMQPGLTETPQPATNEQPAIVDYDTWYESKRAKDPTVDSADGLSMLRDYSRETKLAMLRTGQYTPQRAAYLDAGIMRRAQEDGFDLGDDPVGSFRTPTHDTDAGIIARHARDTGNPLLEERARGYQALLSPRVRSSFQDEASYQAKLTEAREALNESLPGGYREEARKAAVQRGDLPFTTLTEPDGTQRVFFGQGMKGITDDDTLAQVFKAHPSLDINAIESVRSGLRTPDGYEAPAYEIERQAQFFNLLERSAQDSPASVGQALDRLASARNSGGTEEQAQALIDQLDRDLANRGSRGEFTPEESKRFIEDAVRLRHNPEVDEDNVDNNLIRLSTGQYRLPDGVMLRRDLFEKTLAESKVLPDSQKENLRRNRSATLDAMAPSAMAVIAGRKGGDFLAFQRKGIEAGKSQGEILDDWMADPGNAPTAWDRYLGGGVTSFADSVSSLVLGPMALMGSEEAANALVSFQKSQASRRAYGELWGRNLGFAFDLETTAIPLAVDIATVFAGGGVTKQAVKAAAAPALADARTLGRTLTKAASEETQLGMRALIKNTMERGVTTATRDSITKFMAQGRLAAPGIPEEKLFADAAADFTANVLRNADKITNAGTIATMNATWFNRSASSTYASILAARMEQGDSFEEARNTALPHALLAGAATVAITNAFNFLGAKGLEKVFTKDLTYGQLRTVYNRLRTDVGKLDKTLVSELDTRSFDTFVRSALNKGVKDTFLSLREVGREATNEALEEATDQAFQSLLEQHASGKPLDFDAAIKEAVYAGALGGILGGGVTGVRTMMAGEVDPATEQAIRVDKLGTIANQLETTGNSPEMVKAIRALMEGTPAETATEAPAAAETVTDQEQTVTEGATPAETVTDQEPLGPVGPTVEGPTVEGPTVEGPTVEGPQVEGPTGPTVKGPQVETDLFGIADQHRRKLESTQDNAQASDQAATASAPLQGEPPQAGTEGKVQEGVAPREGEGAAPETRPAVGPQTGLPLPGATTPTGAEPPVNPEAPFDDLFGNPEQVAASQAESNVKRAGTAATDEDPRTGTVLRDNLEASGIPAAGMSDTDTVRTTVAVGSNPTVTGGTAQVGTEARPTIDTKIDVPNDGTEVARQLKEANLGGGVRAFLNHVAQGDSKIQRQAARALLRVAPLLDGVNIRFVNIGTEEGFAAFDRDTEFKTGGQAFTGLYNHSTRTLIVNTGRMHSRGARDTMLHELLHAASEEAVSNPNAEQVKILKRMDKLRLAARRQGGPRMDYATSDNAEFVSHFWTDPEFRAELASLTPDGETNWLTVLSNMIRQIVNAFKGKGGTPSDVSPELMADMMSLMEGSLGQDARATGDGGVRMQYAGENAQMDTFRRDSLDTAKAMAAAGKSSEEIRAVTGWFPGKYDGKMRWEIPDDEAKFTSPMVFKPAADAFAAGETGEQFVGNLGGVLSHEALYAAYPQLRNVEVTMMRDLGGANAEFQQGNSLVSPTIRVSYTANPRGIKSVVLHEIQHAIQSVEGTAKGASPEMFAGNNLQLMVNKQRYIDSLKPTLALLERVGPVTDAKIGQMTEEEKNVVSSAWNDRTKTWKTADDIRNQIKRTQKEIDAIDFDGSESYNRTAGEIEARDVQARMRFTPEQRAAIAPYSSENIAPEDAIVRFQPAERPFGPSAADVRLQGDSFMAARPAPEQDGFPTDEQINQAQQTYDDTIRQYLTGNWPADPEGRVAELLRFAQSWMSQYAGVPFRLSSDQGTRTQLRYDGDSGTYITIGRGILGRAARLDGEFSARRLVADAAQEEVIHYAHHQAVLNRLGPDATNEDALYEMRRMLVEPIIAGDEEFTRAAFNSATTYFGVEMADVTEDTFPTVIDSLIDTTPNVLNKIIGETVRQVVQMRTMGRINEQETRTLPIIQWLTDRLNAIKDLARNLGRMGDLFRKDVLETERMLATLRGTDVRLQPAERPTPDTVARTHLATVAPDLDADEVLSSVDMEQYAVDESDEMDGFRPGSDTLRMQPAESVVYEAQIKHNKNRKAWLDAAKRFFGEALADDAIPVVENRYMRVSDFPESLRDLLIVAEASNDLSRETDMAGNDILEIVTSPYEKGQPDPVTGINSSLFDMDMAFRNRLRDIVSKRDQAISRIKEKTKGLYSDSEIIQEASSLPALRAIESEDSRIRVTGRASGMSFFDKPLFDVNRKPRLQPIEDDPAPAIRAVIDTEVARRAGAVALDDMGVSGPVKQRVTRMLDEVLQASVSPATIAALRTEPDVREAHLTHLETVYRSLVDSRDATRGAARLQPVDDAAYIAAVESGDMETAQQMVDEAAKAAGYGVKAYHGTDAPEFTEFETQRSLKGGKTADPNAFVGAHFSKVRNVAEKFANELYGAKNGRVMDVSLRLQNPLQVGKGESAEILSRLEKESNEAFAREKDERSAYDRTKPSITPEEQRRRLDIFAKSGDINDLIGPEPEPPASLKASEEATKKAVKALRDFKENNRPLTEREILEFAGFDYDKVFSQWEQKPRSTAKRVGTRVREALEAAGYDGVVYTIAYEAEAGMGTRGRTAYIALYPSQIKSADPVTYDANGKIIPLSQRFQSTSPDIRFQPLEDDTDSPQTAVLIDRVGRAWHRASDGHRVRETVKQYDPETGGDGLAEVRMQVDDQRHADLERRFKAGDETARAEAERMVEEAAKAAGYTTEAWKGYSNQPNRITYPPEKAANQPIENFNRITILRRPSPFPTFDAGNTEPEVRIAAFFAEDQAVAQRFRDGIGDEAGVLGRFYLNLGNSKEFDGKGVEPAANLQFFKSGKPFRDAVRSGEFDSITLRNTKDEGNVFVTLNPDQIKSADPFTYDDNGNLIPLSERFNQQSPDIRFQPAETVTSNDVRQYPHTFWLDTQEGNPMFNKDVDPPERESAVARWLVRMFARTDDLPVSISRIRTNYEEVENTVKKFNSDQVSRWAKITKKGITDEQRDHVSNAIGSTAPLLTAAEADRIRRESDDAFEAIAENDATERKALRDASRETRKAYLEDLLVERIGKQGKVARRKALAIYNRLVAQEKTALDKRLAELDNKTADARRAVVEMEREKAIAAEIKHAAELRNQRDMSQDWLDRNAPELGSFAKDFRNSIDEVQRRMLDLFPNSSHPGLHAKIDRSLGIHLVRSYEIHRNQALAEKILKDPRYEDVRNSALAFFRREFLKDYVAELRNDPANSRLTEDELEEIAAKKVADRELVRLTSRREGQQALGDGADQTIANATDEELEAAAAKYLNERVQTAFENLIIGNEVSFFKGDTAPVKLNVDRFRMKRDLPKEIRDALQEITDPLENATRTMEMMADIVLKTRQARDIARVGRSKGLLKDASEVHGKDGKLKLEYRNWQALTTANAPSMAYQDTAGLYAPPEFKQAFDAAFNHSSHKNMKAGQRLMHETNRGLMRLAGTSMLFMTQGSPGYYTRNIVGGGIMALANGVNPFNRSLSAVWANTLGDKPGAAKDFAMEMMSHGLLNNSSFISYMDDMIKAGVKSPEEAQDFIGRAIEKVTSGGRFKGAAGTVQSALDFTHNLAQFTETWYVPSVYMYWKDVFRRSGMTDELKIQQHAAERTKELIPVRSRSPQAVEGFRTNGISALLAPFIGFKTDMMRNTVNTWRYIIRDMASDNEVLKSEARKRAASATAVHAGVTMIMPILIGSLMGIGRDEDEAIRAALPSYAKNSLFMPIRGKDSLQLWDFTFMNPYSILFDPVSHSIRNTMWGRPGEIVPTWTRWVGEDIFGENILAGNIMDIRRNKDETTGMPVFLESDTDFEKTRKSLMHVLNGAYNPVISKKTWQVIEASRAGKDAEDFFYTPLGIIAGTIAPIKPRSYRYEDMEYRAYAGLRRANSELWMLTRNATSPAPLDPGSVPDMMDDRKDAARRIWSEADTISRGFQGLGRTKQNQYGSMVRAGFSKKRSQQLINTRTTDVPVMSEENIADMRKADPLRVVRYYQWLNRQPRNIVLGE